MTDTPKRPRDPNQLAKLIADTATGEAQDAKPKDKGRQASGVSGGAARARELTPEQREAIAKKAASARRRKDHPVPETKE